MTKFDGSDNSVLVLSRLIDATSRLTKALIMYVFSKICVYRVYPNFIPIFKLCMRGLKIHVYVCLYASYVVYFMFYNTSCILLIHYAYDAF